MKFEHTEVFNFEGALRGMRNPKNSWSKSDSNFSDDFCHIPEQTNCKDCPLFMGFEKPCAPVIGENDMKLATALIRGGSEHRKFLRQIFVSVDITAPLYWWKEFDTYKVGTVANSTSTMHKLTSNPITLECFEIDDYDGIPEKYNIDHTNHNTMVNNIIVWLEHLRNRYLATKDKKYWKELIRWLPESWLQTRTVTMNYENILTICKQRTHHKLNEWSGSDDSSKPNFISWAKTLPYAKEFIFQQEECDNEKTLA